MTNEIVTTEIPQSALLLTVPMDIILQRYQAQKDFVSQIMKEKLDFGKVPGTDRNTLYKPGAEKLLNFFNLHPIAKLHKSIEDYTGAEHSGEAFFYYEYEVQVFNAEGVMVANAFGSANSWETKYRFIWSKPPCPTCGTGLVRKRDGGAFCPGKENGCGRNVTAGDMKSLGLVAERVRDPNIFDKINTLQKMALKRGLVAVALIATCASEYFTQDLEDFIDGEITETPLPPKQQQPAKEAIANAAVDIVDMKPETAAALHSAVERKSEKAAEKTPALTRPLESVTLKNFIRRRAAKKQKEAPKNSYWQLIRLLEDALKEIGYEKTVVGSVRHMITADITDGKESLNVENPDRVPGNLVYAMIDWITEDDNLTLGTYAPAEIKGLISALGITLPGEEVEPPEEQDWKDLVD